MSGHSAIEALLRDHTALHEVLDMLETDLRAALEPADYDDKRLGKTLEALLVLDALHHEREELLLVEIGRVRRHMAAGPLRTIREEHRQMAARRDALIEDLNRDGVDPQFGRTARQMIAGMREHMRREEGHLFPFARLVLKEPAMSALVDQLASLDADQRPIRRRALESFAR